MHDDHDIVAGRTGYALEPIAHIDTIEVIAALQHDVVKRDRLIANRPRCGAFSGAT